MVTGLDYILSFEPCRKQLSWDWLVQCTCTSEKIEKHKVVGCHNQELGLPCTMYVTVGCHGQKWPGNIPAYVFPLSVRNWKKQTIFTAHENYSATFTSEHTAVEKYVRFVLWKLKLISILFPPELDKVLLTHKHYSILIPVTQTQGSQIFSMRYPAMCNIYMNTMVQVREHDLSACKIEFDNLVNFQNVITFAWNFSKQYWWK